MEIWNGEMIFDALPRCPEDSRYIRSFPAPLPFQCPLSDTGCDVSSCVYPSAEEAAAFFHEWGFIVFRDIFTADECAATRDAMWSVVENAHPGLLRQDASTWDCFKQTGKYGLSSRGPCFDPQLVKNRQNPRLAAALALILKTQLEDVMVSHDRFTVYRATVLADELGDGSRFRTGPRNVHLDMNPWWWLEASSDILVGADSLQYADPQDFIKENNLVTACMGPHVQCVLNFSDNLEEDGGTLVVPRFHRHVESWAARYSWMRKPLPWVTFQSKREVEEAEAPLLALAQRVPLREGSVLIWDQTVMHGTQPNASSSCRTAQFLKAFSRAATFKAVGSDGWSGDGVSRLQRRARALQKLLPPDVVSPLGRTLFGLDVCSDISDYQAPTESEEGAS